MSPLLQGWPLPDHLISTANLGYPSHQPPSSLNLHSTHCNGLLLIFDGSVSRICSTLVAGSIAAGPAFCSIAVPYLGLLLTWIVREMIVIMETTITSVTFIKHLLYMPSLAYLYILSHLILMTSHYCPHFTDEVTRAQRD